MTKKRICYYVPRTAYVEGQGYRASVVVEGESGHHPTGVWPQDGRQERPYFLGHDYDEAAKRADRMNLQLGLSSKDVTVIVASSMRAQAERDRDTKTPQRGYWKSGLKRYYADQDDAKAWVVRDRNADDDEPVSKHKTRQEARREACRLNVPPISSMSVSLRS